MTLAEVKLAINWNQTVQFNKAITINETTKVTTEWANGWIDADRLRISIPMDIYLRLKGGEAMSTLMVKREAKIGKTSKEPYTSIIICAYKPGDLGGL